MDDMAELTVGSLFSGIGGLDLGLERAGMRVIWQSEIDPFANKVLKKHWPEVVNHGNIKEIDWETVERPNVICGGYPCQPFSTAGKRRGEEDPRHLWPWVRDAISRLRPEYAILENVRGHLTLGGLSVIGELASIGYDAEWRIVSAASVGANHRRDRIIIVAYPNDARPHRAQIDTAETGEQAFCGVGGCCADVANANNSGCTSRPSKTEPKFDRCCEDCAADWPRTTNNSRVSTAENVAETTEQFSTGRGFGNGGKTVRNKTQQAQIGRANSDGNMADSVSGSGGFGPLEHDRTKVFGWEDYLRGENGYAGWPWWQTEPDVGRVAYGVPNRVDRLRGLGNAVVPQVAEVIGRLVVAHDAQRT